MTMFANVNPTTGVVVRVFELLPDPEAAALVQRSATAYPSWSRIIDEPAAVLARMALHPQGHLIDVRRRMT